MNEKELITYYNKFNEDKRLNTRHGQIEFITTMKYIHEYLKEMKKPEIIEIGAGTGKYSISLANEGYSVTAIELVKHNLRVIEKNSKLVKTFQGNATNLREFQDNSFDMVLLFGPLYHLISENEKVTALKEAKRIVKDTGIIMVAYCMNDYAIITHGFIDNNIKESIKNNLVDDTFKLTPKENDLYSRLRLNDINRLNELAGLTRIKIITPDGPANYLRKSLNKMDEETFNLFLKYHLATCELPELLGASAHTVDILKK